MLKAFEAFGRAGGIRRAAGDLGLDHAVVSRHLRALEDWLGVSLFERDAGRVALTVAGKAYHAQVSQTLLELSHATDELLHPLERRSVQIWGVPGLTTQWLAGVLAEFQQANPHCQLELRPTDTPADLLARDADVDIRFYGDAWPPEAGGRGLKTCELSRPPVMAVCSPDLARRIGSIKDLRQLLAYTLIHEEHDEQWRAWFLAKSVSIPGPIPGPRMWHAHLAIAAAVSGMGIALANRFLVDRELMAGSLVRLVLPDGSDPVIGSYRFVTRVDDWSTPIVARLRQFIRKKAN